LSFGLLLGRLSGLNRESRAEREEKGADDRRHYPVSQFFPE
jgi:hypothetical protein